MIRGWELVLVFALEVHITAQVKIQAPVAIVIRRRHARERTLRARFEMKGVRLFAKYTVTLVNEQERTRGAQHNQVLMPGVAEIGEKRAGGFIENAGSSAGGYIFRRTIGTHLVQPVRKSARLADVDLVGAVVVDIGHGDSLVPVNVDAHGGIQPRAPIGIAVEKLLF